MAEFAKYAFNKSHAAAYAVVSYRTAYLKAYYPAEFMAAMLNSFLGNQNKIPEYIEECKRLSVEILQPDINKSDTKFTVDKNQIRFGMGSIKNVGTAAVDEIVAERNKNGEFKDFGDFCERIKNSAVNKKCVESLIKSGSFDNLGHTRKTLIASFENIIDTIANNDKKNFDGQVSMFDIGNTAKEEMKYNYTILPEYDKKELLSMEKEMLGLYISGHPLENIREQLEAKTNINSMDLRQIGNNAEGDGSEPELENYINNQTNFRDGQNVTYAGIITSIKKKYTKNNNLMAFVTVEDLYGQAEIIVFDSCYRNCSSVLIDENIVVVEGRLSIREDEEAKIVAKSISAFTEAKHKVFELDITNADEETKEKLRGAIHFFQGDKNNIQLQIVNGDKVDKAGGIYITPQILKQFEEILGEGKAGVKEI